MQKVVLKTGTIPTNTPATARKAMTTRFTFFTYFQTTTRVKPLPVKINGGKYTCIQIPKMIGRTGY